MKGHLRRKGRGSWQLSVDLPKRENEKRKRKYYSIHASGKREAQKKANRILADLESSHYATADGITVGAFLGQWLEQKTSLAPSTLIRYREIIRNHLVPALGCTALEKLRPIDISSYYKTAQEVLSPTTVLHHHRVLSQALKTAMRWGMLSSNPAAMIDPPKQARKEFAVLNIQETLELVTGAKSSRFFPAILLGAYAGMRRGEILGLTWSNVDLDAARLSVLQSLEKDFDGGLRFKQPKTATSRRMIPLSKFVIEGLREHRQAQLTRRLELGPAWQEHDLVCPDLNGAPWPPNNFSPAIIKYLRKQGASIRFHDLRHTHATHLLQANIHPKIASARLGHASTDITLNLYSHLLPGMGEEAADKIQAGIEAALGDKLGDKSI